MRLWQRFRRGVIDHEGSTRAIALIRVGLVFTMWTRFGELVRPFDSLLPERLVLSAAFFLITTLLLVGRWTRVVAPLNALLLLAIYYGFGHGLFGFGAHEPWTHHHIYAMVMQGVLLAMTPCGRSLSWDRWAALARAERAGEPAPDEVGPLWATRLMCWQVVTMYLWTAYDKSYLGFLQGDRLGMAAAELYFSGDLPDGVWFALLLAVLGTSTVVIEWLLPVALLFPRTHRVSVPVGLAMHAAFHLLLPVATFTGTMWLYYLAIVRPQAVHDVTSRLLGGPHRAT